MMESFNDEDSSFVVFTPPLGPTCHATVTVPANDGFRLSAMRWHIFNLPKADLRARLTSILFRAPVNFGLPNLTLAHDDWREPMP